MPSSFTAGTKLGRYEIRSRIGAGGMGEVFLGQDTGLDRKVALKLLPEELASNPMNMQRFVQEAKAASALNHPNILTIYEIGAEPGTHYIATEFIEGETLRRRMNSDPLTMAQAIDIALQVASALSTAHAAGIIHRDIKPENVMIRNDGIVKVLDFGLAKLTDRWRANEVDADAATQAMALTQPGVVVGTTAYMSPEQTRALDIDTRTDIWSLGVLLFEMITGRPPFKGETASDTSAAILKTDPPPLSQYLADTPFELERIVKKALQKDREERYQVVKDLQLDLKSLKRDLDLGSTLERSTQSQRQVISTAEAATTIGSSRNASTKSSVLSQLGPGQPHWFWIALVLLVPTLAFTVWFIYQRQKGTPVQFANLTVAQLVSRKNDLGEPTTSHARFSPDGKFVAYAAAKGAVSSIWLKQVGSGEPFSNATEQATSPVWSPDGQQIAFLSKRDAQVGIWTMAAFGGSPTLLKTLENPGQGLVSWSRQGQIYFTMQGNLYALDLHTQQIVQITKFDPSTPRDRYFGISPDEKMIAFSDLKDNQRDIFVMAKSGGEPSRVTNDKAEDTKLAWTPDGENIVYSSKRNGIKQICLGYVDGREPVQLTVNDNNSEVLDVSPDGTKILYVTFRDDSDVWGVNLDQLKETQVTADTGIELWPDVSADNRTVSFQTTQSTSAATLVNGILLTRSVGSEAPPVRLTGDGFAPRWSPDGKQVAFLRSSNAGMNLWTVSGGGGDEKPVTTGGIVFGGFTLLPYNRAQTQDYQWTADGRSLVYCSRDSGVANVWQAALDGSRPTQLSDNTNANLHFFNPLLSPDGSRVVWVAMLPPSQGEKKATWSIWLAKDGKGQQLAHSDDVLGLVGWSPSGDELIIKSILGLNNATNFPATVQLSSLSVKNGGFRQLAQVKSTYFQNIQLAPARNLIAIVTREPGADSLETIPITGGVAKTILTSNDQRVYLAGIAWSPDGKTIYYGKQSSSTVLSMIDNFKSK
jgi:serine/threonine protein kinase